MNTALEKFLHRTAFDNSHDTWSEDTDNNLDVDEWGNEWNANPVENNENKKFSRKKSP